MKRIYSLFLIAILFATNYSYSQTEEHEHDDHEMEECGARHTKESIAFEQKSERHWQDYKRNHKTLAGGEVLSFPVQVHIIRQSGGTGGLTVAELDEMLDRLNEIYLDAKVVFYQCGSINYIDDDAYYDFDEADENVLTAAHDVSNVCNIYFCNSITDGGSGLCGYAYYPGGPDRVFMDNGCAKNGSTLAHEMGHYFALRHTHNGGDELVDGSNCSTAGDDFCDTPADPQLGSSNVDDYGCTYIGTETDGNGQSYNPDVTNIMSYAPRACRFSFSAEQLTRIRFTAENSRNYLTCGSVVPLDAKFESDEQSTCNGSLSVQFYDLSEGSITGWSWDFGDGTPVSTDQDPTHTYNSAGAYDVSLTITDGGGGNSTLTKTAYIKVGAVTVPYSQDFESADALDDFKISDKMRNFTTVESDAGNTGTSGMSMQGYVDYGPSPYFRTPGNATEAFQDLYNPYYKSKNILCVDATTLTSMTLEFDYQQIRYSNNLYTNFRILANGTQVGIYNPSGSTTAWTTESINLDAYVGQVVSLSFEASNKYSRDYISSTTGNATYIDNINITGSAATNTAAFTVDATSGCTTTSYTFTDQSSGTIANYSWDFGSGATPPTATGVGPHTVTYSTEGNKTVSLTVDDGGVNNDTETKTDYITIDNAPCTDCNGELGGTAYIDGCSDCVGGSTGLSPCLPYCSSDFTQGTSEYITNVTFNTINNNSGDAPTDGYEDYTGLTPTDVAQGSTHSFSVTINTTGPYEDFAKVFFDWNQDGDFEDTDESVDLGSVFDETAGVLSTNINIPLSATLGNTRMRVVMMYDASPGPCDSDNLTEYGETEDYTINITTAVNDCNGDPGGSAYMDNCSTCVGGNTGLTACTQDCNGDWGGTAITDNCSDCVEGNTGLTACTQDCNGDWGGTAITDNCSDCVEGNTGLSACTQDCNGDWGGTAITDNCSDCVEGNTGLTACTQDCNGDWGGTAITDNCSNCVEGNTGLTACTQDCNNEWGGTASNDVCGVCSGGSTGITPETNSANCVTAISDLSASGVKAYPNPFSSSILIELEAGFGGDATIEVYTTSGVLVESSACEANGNVSIGKDLAPGIYLVKIFNTEIIETISITKF